MFDKSKTRKGRLEEGLLEEISKDTLNVDNIIELVDVYEQDNLDTIDKCKRDKRLELNKINGALKQTIDAHGPITKVLIGSASKRIYGALLLESPKKQPKAKVSLRYLIAALITGLIIGLML